MTNKTSKRIAALAAIALTACRPLASTAQTAEADTLPPARPGWTYTARLGLNIGGTAPIGMPATIRRMNDYDLQPNFTTEPLAHLLSALLRTSDIIQQRPIFVNPFFHFFIFDFLFLHF